MRLPDSAHSSHPWRIHELTRDFRLEDVWELQAPRDGEELALLARTLASFNPSRSSSTAVRALFALRWKLGALLGWDRSGSGVGARVATLRERLPADLRDRAGPAFDDFPFSSLYLLDDEWAAETANETMHGVLHIGVVEDPEGGRRGQMAVLVKPNGALGNAYMAAIRPFRHLLIYPRLIEEIERSSPAPGRVRQIAVPREARARSTLSRIDYADAFVVDNPAAEERTAEQWIRAILGQAPLAVRSQLLSGWSSIGLMLGRDGVLGWQVRRSDPESVLLGAGSRIGMPGELLLERRPGALLFCTFVEHDNALARTVWAGVEPVHVPVVRRVLEQAAGRCY
ncbi:MAG TPA: DUF2867 domain-containing protein [Solirubrobacteraceae bacterium]|jgi:hypothetical protein